MAKRKYPSEINSRTVRINIKTYHMLERLVRDYKSATMAEALEMAIKQMGMSDNQGVNNEKRY